MGFKMWLEKKERDNSPIANMKVLHPDELLNDNFYSFTYTPADDALYLSLGSKIHRISHADQIAAKNVSDMNQAQGTVDYNKLPIMDAIRGRLGVITKRNKWIRPTVDKSILPLGVISTWTGDTAFTRDKLTKMLQRMMRSNEVYWVTNRKIYKKNIPKLPITTDWVFVPVNNNNIRTVGEFLGGKAAPDKSDFKTYQIGGERFTKDQILDWISQFHTLSPESEQMRLLKLKVANLARSPYADEFSNVLQAAQERDIFGERPKDMTPPHGSTKTAWPYLPRQQLIRTSESFKEWLERIKT